MVHDAGNHAMVLVLMEHLPQLACPANERNEDWVRALRPIREATLPGVSDWARACPGAPLNGRGHGSNAR